MAGDSFLPFTYKSWGHFGLLENTYYQVTFTRDFGVFKAGWGFQYVSTDYDTGAMTAEIDDKEVTQFFKLEPIIVTP